MEREHRDITKQEHWRITCHEAGHAVFAVRCGIVFLYIERGAGEHALLELAINPVDEPDHNWSRSDILKWQEFYAAGAAAERLLFNDDRAYALRCDKCNHAKLETRLKRFRSRGFDEDLKSAMTHLDGDAIEKVATELEKRMRLEFEDVSTIIGQPLPWGIPGAGRS